ncbi:hypothetical protein [Pseudoalteromonas phage J2-1_QLiu-2017]|nr:hypothetical protein [Pseudoalteromonas phage J2-1_QLiu-2017]
MIKALTKSLLGAAIIAASFVSEPTQAARLHKVSVELPQCERYNKLTEAQKERLTFSYYHGKPDDLGYTLAAIALQESQAGVYRVRFDKHPDLGLYHINSKNVDRILALDSYWAKQRAYSQVITDDALGAYMALKVLKEFIKQHNDSWSKAVISYNQGNVWLDKENVKSIKNGNNYLYKIRKNVNLFKQCADWN